MKKSLAREVIKAKFSTAYSYAHARNNFILNRVSKPIPSTLIASPDLALTTLKDVLRQTMPAFFTLVGTIDVSPPFMIAFVVLPKVLHCRS